jgi:thiol:disulfide interchange protein
MTEDIVESMSLNKILVALLEEHGSLSVPTTRFVNAQNTDKELLVEYDDQDLTFKFSLRSRDEQPGNS